MPSSLALLLWFVCVVLLLRFDPARDLRTSLVLWVPLVWMFIVATRLPSQWLGGGQIETVSQALEEGNSLDRAVFVSLYLVILLVVSDPHPIEALRTLLRRLCFLFVPLSILLVKYFPYIGKQYEFWSGNSMFVGAATSKNMLGVACLVSGIYLFWDTLSRWPKRREGRAKPAILVNLVLFAMTLYLLNLSNSATSKVCLALGCLVVAASNLRLIKRHPGILKVSIPIVLCTYMILQFGFGINGEIAGMVGRNANLTGRTDLWKLLLSMHTNAALGTGYESFWLGPRLAFVWQSFTSGINEAHNGYLEVYINLGFKPVSHCQLSQYRQSPQLRFQPGVAEPGPMDGFAFLQCHRVRF